MTHGVRGGGDLQGAGGEVGVLVLELAVQGEPPLVLVVGQQGGGYEYFAQGEAWRNGTPLPESPPPSNNANQTKKETSKYFSDYRY